jgi:hypothetical protein
MVNWPAIAFVLLFARLCLAQGDFQVAGTVVNSVTGAPVAGALVTLRSSPRARTTTLPKQLSGLSETGGLFRFAGLAAGQYVLNVEKPGFQRDYVHAETFEIGPSRENVALKLEPFAKLGGTVTDRGGAALSRAAVRAFRTEIQDGRRVFRQSRSVTSDDLGHYRLWNLAPGDYFVMAAGRGGGTALVIGHATAAVNSHESFAPVYYGGAGDRASATPIPLAAGQEFEANLTATLQPAYRVRGRIQNTSAYQQVQIELLRGGQDVSATRASVNATTGQFDLQDVVPGTYLVRATQGTGDAERRGEREIVVTNGDLQGVTLSLAAPVAVTAAFRLIRPQPERRFYCGFSLQPTDGPADGGFGAMDGNQATVTGIFPGRYHVVLRGCAGTVVSMLAGNENLLPDRDLVVAPGMPPRTLEIVLDTDGGKISGKAAAPDATSVLLLPVTGGEPVIDIVMAGAFEVEEIAPGDYQAYLVKNLDRLEYRNPEVLRTLGRGVAVHVDKSATTKVELREIAK